MRASTGPPSSSKQQSISIQATLLLESPHQLRQRDSMRGPNSTSTTSKGGAMAGFKQDLLRNLLLGIRACRPFDATSLEDRKRAVKRSADVAMAAARAAAGGARARWPKAILAAAAAAASGHSPDGTRKARKSACRRVVRRPRRAAASCDVVARRLVRSRTMALRKVIPGADAAAAAMDDEAVLLRETIDYAVHLRAQVDVLRRVSAAVQRSTFLRDGPAQSMGGGGGS